MFGAYDKDLRTCPKCDGRVVMISAGENKPCVMCTECETVYIPDMDKAVKLWWNNEKA